MNSICIWVEFEPRLLWFSADGVKHFTDCVLGFRVQGGVTCKRNIVQVPVVEVEAKFFLFVHVV